MLNQTTKYIACFSKQKKMGLLTPLRWRFINVVTKVTKTDLHDHMCFPSI